jgi:hypothetical protein
LKIEKCKVLSGESSASIIAVMQFRLGTIGVCVLAGAVMLSGVINNAISGLCVLMSLVCWFAAIKTNGGVLLGLLATCGWLFLAALVAVAFR